LWEYRSTPTLGMLFICQLPKNLIDYRSVTNYVKSVSDQT
jgi:hypothetical protein